MWINRICAELFLESRGKGRKLRRKRRGMERGERARTRTLCICIFLVAYEDLISLLLRFEVMIEHWKIGLNTKIIQLCQKNLGMFKDRQRPICQPITHPRELSTKPAPYLSLNFLLLLCLLSWIVNRYGLADHRYFLVDFSFTTSLKSLA